MNVDTDVRLLFVYPNGDEVECLTSLRHTIYEAARKVGVQMDTAILPTCKISIQPITSGEAFEDVINSPTEQEITELGEALVYGEKKFRYAHTYPIGAELDGARILLNLVRITYVDRSGTRYDLAAVLDENFMSLRDRNSTKVDLAFACRGGLACATCHCIMVGSAEEPTDDESDLLQYTDGFCDQSRLGCQLQLTYARDGQTITHPGTRRV
jgi:2Fe-2S ferredoxin